VSSFLSFLPWGTIDEKNLQFLEVSMLCNNSRTGKVFMEVRGKAGV
jgi:hypothetical protein